MPSPFVGPPGDAQLSVDALLGAPSIKIRFSALTATDYNTIRSAGVYTREVYQEPASETSNSVPSSPTPAPASVPKSPAETTIAVVYPSQPLRPSSSEKAVILPAAKEIFAEPARSTIPDTFNT